MLFAITFTLKREHRGTNKYKNNILTNNLFLSVSFFLFYWEIIETNIVKVSGYLCCRLY